VTGARRLRQLPGASGRVLIGLLALGLALRVVAILSWWPVTPTLEDGYQRFASNPFLDAQHPAGYGLIVSVLGHISREVAFTVLIQHLTGIVAALLLLAATRRVTGSAWAGLLPAAVLLLDPDGIFLEHSIMSESWVILTIAAGLYAATRCFDDPLPIWRWPLITAVALAASAMIRTAAVPLILVAAVAVVIGQGSVSRRARLGSAGAMVAVAATLLLIFAGANAQFGRAFGIEPSPGWYLYGRVAQFADCHKFTPPPGTVRLCQTIPPSRRPSAYYYTFEKHSPAVQLLGAFGRSDQVVGGWARRVALAQPAQFLRTAWTYLIGYWVPGTLPARLRASSTGLDPQLDFTNPGNPIVVAAQESDLQTYYNRFTVSTWHGGLRVLRAWQRVFRFGATALVITTLLTLIGLIVGTRRSRAGVLLFGLGALSLILAPALTGTYSGRYTVPMAGPMLAASAITLNELWRRFVATR
jgi:hypothetical protein